MSYSVIFLLVILFFSFRRNPEADKNSNNHENEKWLISKDSITENGNGSVLVTLQTNRISKYSMLIVYGMSKSEHRSIPVSACFMQTGITNVTEWKPASVLITRKGETGIVEYDINGVIKWKLLGFEVYAQQKNYHGFAELK